MGDTHEEEEEEEEAEEGVGLDCWRRLSFVRN